MRILKEELHHIKDIANRKQIELTFDGVGDGSYYVVDKFYIYDEKNLTSDNFKHLRDLLEYLDNE